MSISKSSLQALIQLVEGSLSQVAQSQCSRDQNVTRLKACRHELIQEALRIEQEHFRETHIPFSRRSRHRSSKEGKVVRKAFGFNQLA